MSAAPYIRFNAESGHVEVGPAPVARAVSRDISFADTAGTAGTAGTEAAGFGANFETRFGQGSTSGPESRTLVAIEVGPRAVALLQVSVIVNDGIRRSATFSSTARASNLSGQLAVSVDTSTKFPDSGLEGALVTISAENAAVVVVGTGTVAPLNWTCHVHVLRSLGNLDALESH